MLGEVGWGVLHVLFDLAEHASHVYTCRSPWSCEKQAKLTPLPGGGGCIIHSRGNLWRCVAVVLSAFGVHHEMNLHFGGGGGHSA